MKNKINIELLFLDKLTKNTLSYFFQSSLSQSAQLTESTAKTDIYLVDQYRLESDFIDKKSESENIFFIVLHNKDTKPIQVKNTYWLKKPIDTHKLLALINDIQKKLNRNNQSFTSTKQHPPANVKTNEVPTDSHHNQLYNAVNEENKLDIHQRFKAQKYVGSNKDIKTTEKIPKHVFLTKKRYLYHYLIKAKKMAQFNQSNILIKCFSGNIIYNPKNKTFSHNFDRVQLKYNQTSILPQDMALEFIDEKFALNISNNYEKDEACFIWESAIQASKGRVPKNTSLKHPVNLIAWPNYSRLQIFRYAIQITAVWAKHKLSLIETAKQLQIPQRYVFTLYCAMHAMEYVMIDNSSEKHSLTANQSDNSSLFSKIINHLFG